MNFGELLFLAFLGLLVFGPRKLPEIARTVAKLMAELRRAGNEFRYTLEEEIRSAEIKEQEQKRLAAADAEAPAEPAAVPGTIARES